MDAKLVFDGVEYNLSDLTPMQVKLVDQLQVANDKTNQLDADLAKEKLWVSFLIGQLKDSLEPEQLDLPLEGGDA